MSHFFACLAMPCLSATASAQPNLIRADREDSGELAAELFGMWPESGNFSPQGKGFAMGTRWAPRLMHYIAALPDSPNPAEGRRAKKTE